MKSSVLILDMEFGGLRKKMRIFWEWGVYLVCVNEPVEVIPNVPELLGDTISVPLRLCANSVMR
jgi:hypothetical protein